MNLQLYTSCAASFTENELDEVAFKLNRFKLEIIGNINRKFSYHFRQSFNKYSNPFALENPLFSFPVTRSITEGIESLGEIIGCC